MLLGPFDTAPEATILEGFFTNPETKDKFVPIHFDEAGHRVATQVGCVPTDVEFFKLKLSSCSTSCLQSMAISPLNISYTTALQTRSCQVILNLD